MFYLWVPSSDNIEGRVFLLEGIIGQKWFVSFIGPNEWDALCDHDKLARNYADTYFPKSAPYIPEWLLKLEEEKRHETR